MTVALVLLVVISVLLVGLSVRASRRAAGDPVHTVDGFSRALHALAPDPEPEVDPDGDAAPGWRARRRERR